MQKVRGSTAALDIFQGLAGIYRPTGEEDQARNYITGMVAGAQPLWNGRITVASDKARNLLVRVPGTGRFAGVVKPVILQSHLDMVLAVDGLKPGEDARPYFKNGVTTEEVQIDGETWIRSAGAKTTLGADDAQGVAVALRYLVEPSLEHPPLELVFTTQEEQGMVGARSMSLPLQGRVLLNLDTPTRGAVTRGCRGVTGGRVRGSGATAPVAAGARELQLTIGGLRGGHTGVDIHKNRLNAIAVAAELTAIAASFGARLIDATAGDGLVVNKITDAATWTLSAPADAIAKINDALQARFSALVQTHDEDPAKAMLTATARDPVATRAFTLEATQRFGSGVAAVPNGVIVSDPQYPDSVRVSSNLGVLRADAKSGAIVTIFAARTYTTDEATLWQTNIEQAFAKAVDVAGVDRDHVDPWLLPADHWLVKAALSLGKGKFATSVLTPGTIECGPIAALYSGMAAISIGAEVVDEHTPRERIRKSSIQESADATQSLLEVLGEELRHGSNR